MNLNERPEHVQKFRLCFNCRRAGLRSKDCKSRSCSMPNCGQRHNKLFSKKDFSKSDFSKKEATTSASDATTAVATMITQGGLPVVYVKLVNGTSSLSVLAVRDTGFSISFVDKSIVSTLSCKAQKHLCQ